MRAPPPFITRSTSSECYSALAFALALVASGVVWAPALAILGIVRLAGKRHLVDLALRAASTDVNSLGSAAAALELPHNGEGGCE